MKINVLFLSFLFIFGSESVSYDWGAWGKWPLKCSKQCGEGERCRYRKCMDGEGIKAPDSHCHGLEKQCESCMVRQTCPNLPSWESWGSWSDCQAISIDDEFESETVRFRVPLKSKDCMYGYKFRKRDCNTDSIEARAQIIECSGHQSETHECIYKCGILEGNEDPIDAIRKALESEFYTTYGRREFNFKTVYSTHENAKITINCLSPMYKKVFDILNPNPREEHLPREVIVTWTRNGEILGNPEVFRIFSRYLTEPEDDVKKEISWQIREEVTFDIAKDIRSQVHLSKTSVTIANSKKEWSGIYQCQYAVGRFLILAKIFFVSVTPRELVYHEHQLFILDSNLGINSILSESHMKVFDSAQIEWYQNGVKRFSGPAINILNRIRNMGTFEQSMVGEWVCYLLIYSIGPSGWHLRGTSKLMGKHIINRIFVKMSNNKYTMWQQAELNSSTALLKNFSFWGAILAFATLLVMVGNFFALAFWLKTSLGFEMNSVIIEEKITDIFKWFILVKGRANARLKEMENPIVMMEQKVEDEWAKLIAGYEKK